METDQAAARRKIGVLYGSNPETCPVRNLQTWIEQAAISSRRSRPSSPGVFAGSERSARGRCVGQKDQSAGSCSTTLFR
jgi:hypothetical protein